MPQDIHLDLFLDESGRFTEQIRGPEGSRQDFHSQLAGVLAPAGSLTRASADVVLRRCYRAGGLDLPDESHGIELRRGEAFDTVITALAAELDREGWQAVRLVNREQVDFGGREATYTHMLAELVVRLFERQRRAGFERFRIDLKLATVFLGHDEQGYPCFLERGDYRKSLREHLAMTAVRLGLAREYADLVVGDLEIGSGKTWRTLQICDLVSNASHGDGRKCGQEAWQALASALGEHDLSLCIREHLQAVDGLVGAGALGEALFTIAEALVVERDALSDETQSLLLGRLDGMIARLAGLGSRERSSRLGLVALRLEQVIDMQRDLDVGHRLLAWFLERVEAPLREVLTGEGRRSLDPFSYALHRVRLTAANHAGDLAAARSESDHLDGLVPRVAGHWEHVDLLMEGLVAQAVHLTDRCEWDEACRRMELVDGYYGSLSELFVDAMPDTFPERVRSDLRARALGTWLQAEVFAGLTEPARLERAREVSDRALDEFVAADDRQRQFQYRCQLETADGRLADARSWLARSLAIEDDSHAAIGEALVSLPFWPQGFGLLHWSRLGAACCASDRSGEGAAFLSALARSKLLSSPWCLDGDGMHYPAHGIRRHLALALAAAGDADRALSMLGHLRSLEPRQRGEAVLVAILAASQLEVAALTWTSSPRPAWRLLDDETPGRLGAIQLVRYLQGHEGPENDGFRRLMEGWTDGVREVLSGELVDDRVRSRLLGMGRAIGY